MSEDYRFLRYYLPGSLLVTYVTMLIIPNLSSDALETLGNQTIVGIFAGAFVASPVIGYVIYAPYNYVYELLAKNSKLRKALAYIERADFTTDSDLKREVKKNLKCFTQEKEFLDLIQNVSFKRADGFRVNPQINGVLRNHLSAFAARVVCGAFVPFFSILSYCFVLSTLSMFGIHLRIAEPAISIPLYATIIIISVILLADCRRVLLEAFQLEEYLVRSKSGEVEQLARLLFSSKGVSQNSQSVR